MKKLSLLLLFFTAMTQAQIVNIPDQNFKTRLITANSSNSTTTAATISADGTYYISTVIDTNGNGEIEYSEAAVIDLLDISNYNGSPNFINSIEGIEAFINLKSLNCAYNLLTSLNLTGLNYLKTLYCIDNMLTQIDFSVLPLLESANCASNQFTTLDFSNNPFFYDLGAANNEQLTTINLQNNVIQNTVYGIQACDGFFNCPNLNLICSDSNEISLIQQMISYSLPTQTVNVENCILGNDVFGIRNEIKIYPNPTSSFVTINSNEIIKSIQLFDVQGRIINTFLINETKTNLDLSTYSNGIYFLKVITDRGLKIEKIVKE